VLQAQPTVAWASQRILSDSNAGFTENPLALAPSLWASTRLHSRRPGPHPHAQPAAGEAGQTLRRARRSRWSRRAADRRDRKRGPFLPGSR